MTVDLGYLKRERKHVTDVRAFFIMVTYVQLMFTHFSFNDKAKPFSIALGFKFTEGYIE